MTEWPLPMAPVATHNGRTQLVEDAKENELRISAFWEKTLHEGLMADLSRLNPSTPLNVLGVSVYHDPQNIFYYIASASDKPAPRGTNPFGNKNLIMEEAL